MQEHQGDRRELRLLGVIADTSKRREKNSSMFDATDVYCLRGGIEKKLADPFVKPAFLPASVAAKATRKHLNKLETHPANGTNHHILKLKCLLVHVSSY